VTGTDLEHLRRYYASAVVGLEEFANLVGVSSSTLRADRRRNGFPRPVRTGSRPGYRLDELLDWLDEHFRGKRSPDALKTQTWLLRQSTSSCAAAHQAESTFRLIAGIALLLANGWEPDLGDPSEVPPLLGPARTVRLAPPSVDVEASHLPAGFHPAPAPSSDPAVMDRLLRSTPAIGDDDHAANLAAWEVLRTWALTGAEENRDQFTALIESEVALFASPSDKARPRTSAFESRLLIALADLKAGQIVLDPAVGEAHLLTNAVAATRDRSPTQRIGVIGRDNAEAAWLVAKLRLGLRGIQHRLGKPDEDSLNADGLASLQAELPSGQCERILVQLDVGSVEMKSWIDRVRALLAHDTGLAVAAFPATSVIPPAKGGRQNWWRDVKHDVAALVITSERSGTSTGTGTFVLHKGFERPTLLVQVHLGSRPQQTTTDRADTKLQETINAVRELVHAHLAGDEPTEGTIGHNITFRPLEHLALTSFMPPRWDDLHIIRDAMTGRSRIEDEADSPNVTAHEAVGPRAPASQHGGSPAKPTKSGIPIPADQKELVEQAIDAAHLLRWLIDAGTDAADQPLPDIPTDLHGFLATVTTEEMRRSLKRLEAKLDSIARN
jgi:hypothetical protein